MLDTATGEVLATAEGTFIAVPERQLQRLKERYGMRRIATATRSTGETTDRGGRRVTSDRHRALTPA